ncbi:MAG TPA: DUF4202 domain-containing protein [Polyangiaceae bacterium]|nr:DUF4202 domain-containing protein [Polyangiaceae bacterium]
MDRFERAKLAFDQLNGLDPVTETVDGKPVPRLIAQADRLSHWIERLEPNASEPLRLAARCQHIERWKIARDEFPPGRVGYLQWRTKLARFHADRAEGVLQGAGYDDDDVQAVRRIVTKQNLHSNADSQTMEDALCLVFLEFEFDAFLQKYPDEEKAIEILQKSWKKMSLRGRQAALTLPFAPRARQLIEAAL